MTKLTDLQAALTDTKKAAIDLVKSGAADQAAFMRYAELTAGVNLLNSQIYLLQIDQAIAAAVTAEKENNAAIEAWKIARRKAAQARDLTEDKRRDLRVFINSQAARGAKREEPGQYINREAEYQTAILQAETSEKLAEHEYSKSKASKAGAAVKLDTAQEQLAELKKGAGILISDK